MIHAHDRITDEVRELASLYAIGAMPSVEAENYAAHLGECAVCNSEVREFEAVAAELGETCAIAPPAALKAQLMDRTAAPARKLAPVIDFVLRGEDGDWTPVPHSTGVYRRRLFLHPTTGDETVLVRMDPGGKFPAHPHLGVEQLYVISGELTFDDHTLYAGDYEAASAGHHHAAATTKTGCMILVVHRPLAA